MGSLEQQTRVGGESSGPVILDRLVEDGAKHHDEVSLPFESRSRSRLRARTAGGVDVALVLPRGTVLRDGALVASEALCVRVRAADEDVLEVRATSVRALMRVAYHLGNRHVPVQVEPDRLLLGYDSVLADLLIGLGASVQRRWSAFEPEGGAYGHGH